MTRPRSTAAVPRAAALAALLALGGCGKKEKPAQPPPVVGVVRPISAEVSGWDEVVGRFVSIEAVDVRPRVSGYVTRVAFRDGQDVRRGDLLFVIDPRPYLATLARAEAAVQRQRATLATAQVELRRARELLLVQATTQQEVQRRLVEAQQAAADLASARADARAAALDVSFTRVRAAVGGRVSDRKVNPGNLVTADQTILTSIVTLDPIRFAFEMPEAVYLSYTRSGSGGRDAPVQVRLQDETGYPHRGRVEFVDSQVTTGTGTVRGRAVIPNPDRGLTPGLFGQMRLTGAAPVKALLVPDSAVTQDQDRSLVMLVDGQSKVREQAVITGPQVGAWRVISSGINTGQWVIVAGGQKVKPGTAVRLQLRQVPPPKTGEAEPNQGYAVPEQNAGIVVVR